VEASYSMADAAKLVPMCRRKLQDFIKRHPFYYLNGTRKLFTASDINAIRAAMRQEAEEDRERAKQCLSSLSRHVRAKRPSIPSVAPTSGPIWTEARRRLTELRQGSSSPSGKTKSNVVPLPSKANPHS
jgi:hypothetical protein